MLSIFNDEQRICEPIWPNPFRTWRFWPLDFVAKRLKWATLPRLSRLASGQNRHADTLTLILNRP